ncbi:MAG: chorismate synthase [bacterium]
MIRFLTSGESHGKGLTSIIEGFPSNIPIDINYINNQLKRRQSGYGRGLRMKIETDTAEVLSGVRFSKTMGSPITLFIKNYDWDAWTQRMNITSQPENLEKITIPRPGHADLVGTQKYWFNDIRNSIERSSARETAARVAACSIAKLFLLQFGITVGSYVESIGGIFSKTPFSDMLFNNVLGDYKDADDLSNYADKSDVRVLDEEQETKIINKIKTAKKRGDTLGGTFITVATGVPYGLGSYMHYDTRLDTEIAASIMSINAVKGVEIGDGFNCAKVFGSESHDEIILNDKNFGRKSNRAGGIEGGISTGLPIIVRGAMKPIATLMSPIQSIDFKDMNEVISRRERSDFVAVPACAVIAESMLAWSIAKYFLDKFGGNSLQETKSNYHNYLDSTFDIIKNNFLLDN